MIRANQNDDENRSQKATKQINISRYAGDQPLLLPPIPFPAKFARQLIKRTMRVREEEIDTYGRSRLVQK